MGCLRHTEREEKARRAITIQWLNESFATEPVSDHPLFLPICEISRTMAEQPAVYFIVMLAGAWDGADSARSVREFDREAGDEGSSGIRVFGLHQHLPLPQMRVLRCLG